METLRFLMISTHFPPQHLGGDAVFVEYLSRELAGRGHEVHVFHSPAVYRMLRGSNPAIPTTGNEGNVIRHPYSSPFGKYGALTSLALGQWGRAKSRLTELVSQLNPDVVHWHNTRGFIGKPFSFPGRVSLHTSHDYTAVCPRSNLLKPGMILCNDPRLCTLCCIRWGRPPQIWRAGRRRVLRFDDDLKVISPSEYLANRLKSEGVPVHEVLRLFVPDIRTNPRANDQERRTLTYLGLLEKHKGVDVLLNAFQKSKDKQGFRLRIIGRGSMKDHLAMRAREGGIQDRVEIMGYLERGEAERIRKDSAAQVVPSVWYENAPLTVMEALSLGVPVIASSIGGLPEMIGHDAGSETFSPGDDASLSELMVSLWNQRDTIEERSKLARRAYERRYSPEIHMAGYLKLVHDIREGKSTTSLPDKTADADNQP
jgi:glycosyltransferase involved in cell wall biosynthesis